MRDTIKAGEKMKVTQIFGIILVFAALVAVFLLSGLYQPVLSASNTSPLPQTLQTAPPPIPNGEASVIGSTDGILIMGFVIMLIILVPVIIFSRRKK